MTDSSPTTAQLVIRAEKAESELELAVEAINSSVRGLETIRTLLHFIRDNVLNLQLVGKLDLLEQLIGKEADSLTTWEIPF